MAQFEMVRPALSQGQSVRRDAWEPIIRIFVSSDMLMCQCGNSTPWQHSLTWEDVTASDWEPIQTVCATQEAIKTSVIPAKPVLRVSDRAMTDLFNDTGARSNPLLSWSLRKWWDI
jgi:hypothetical protein